jgi:hypothetical protein
VSFEAPNPASYYGHTEVLESFHWGRCCAHVDHSNQQTPVATIIGLLKAGDEVSFDWDLTGVSVPEAQERWLPSLRLPGLLPRRPQQSNHNNSMRSLCPLPTKPRAPNHPPLKRSSNVNNDIHSYLHEGYLSLHGKLPTSSRFPQMPQVRKCNDCPSVKIVIPS